MCTAFVHKGNDVIFGFNMDINLGAFDYGVYTSDEWFCIGCPAGLNVMDEVDGGIPSFYRTTDGIRKIHGVSSNGVFTACLNNMNFQKAPFRLTDDACSIDQLMDDLISGRRTLEEAQRFAEQVELVMIPGGAVDVPNPGFHSLSADSTGRILLLEPGNGYALIKEKYAAMTNFSLLELPDDLTDATAGYYGKDRYDAAMRMLREGGDDFSPGDGMKILQAVCQKGDWATRVSFVYSCREKTVRYCLEGDFGDIREHRFR